MSSHLRYLTLLHSDFKKSAERFHPADLIQNMQATVTVSKCLTGEYNEFEWDSSIRWDKTLWAGHELQLFLYAQIMATQMNSDALVRHFADLMDAYSDDKGTAMTRPAWSLDPIVLDSHISYMMWESQHRDHYAETIGLGLQPIPVPIPLNASLSLACS